MANSFDLTLPASSSSSSSASALPASSKLNQRKRTPSSSTRDTGSPVAIMDFVDMTSASPPNRSAAASAQKSGSSSAASGSKLQQQPQREAPKSANGASSLSALQAAAAFKVPHVPSRAGATSPTKPASPSMAKASTSSSSKSAAPANDKPSAASTGASSSSTSGASSGQAKSGTAVKRPSDASNEAFGSGMAKVQKSLSGQNTICHHHQTACPSKLLRCTFIRPNGQQCQLQYCNTVLAKVYNVNRQDIVEAGRNRYGVDPRKHCSSAAARYLWQCPRCRKNCQCAPCREKAAEAKAAASSSSSGRLSGSANGKPGFASSPQSAASSALSTPPTAGSKNKSAAPKDDKSKQAKASSSSDKPAKPSKASSSSKPAKDVQKDKAGKESKTRKEGKASGDGKTAKGSKKQQQSAQDDRRRPSIFQLAASGASASSAASAIMPAAPAKPAAPALPPLKAPKMPKVGVPEMLPIETKLPLPNIRERIWIYETLVRFDCVKVPKHTLGKLDRFDEWTERMLQTMLEHVLKTVAGLDSISSGAPKKLAERAVRAYRSVGSNLQRGEPWEAARKMCEAQLALVPDLPDVEMSANQRADSPDDQQVIIGQSMLAGRSTRARRHAELAAVERVKEQSRKEVTGHVDTDDESDEDTRVDDGYDYGSDVSSNTTPEVSAKTAAAENEDEEDQAPTRGRAGRTKAIVDGSDDEFSVGSPAPPPPRRSTRAPPDAAAAAAAKEAERASPPAPPVPAPPFEQRVAILSATVQLLLQTPRVGEELKSSIEEMTAVERETREEVRALEKAHGEWMEEFLKTCPTALQIEELAKWTAERKKVVDKHQKKLLDARVRMHVQLDALKLRTGPLGFDADGNEYWQLSEYVERKPASVAGRWAWSLIVFGQPFPASGAAPGAEEAKAAKKPRSSLISVDLGASSNDKDRSLSPLTDIDDDGDAEMHDAQEPTELCLSIEGQDEIARLIAWIEYRKQCIEHDEKVADRAVQANGNVPVDVRKQRKERLEAQQAERTAKIKALVDKLKLVRQYYQWHTGDTSAPEPRPAAVPAPLAPAPLAPAPSIVIDG